VLETTSGTDSLAFAVLIERDGEKRLRIEQSLRGAYRPPCGTDPWDIGIQTSMMEKWYRNLKSILTLNPLD